MQPFWHLCGRLMGPWLLFVIFLQPYGAIVVLRAWSLRRNPSKFICMIWDSFWCHLYVIWTSFGDFLKNFGGRLVSPLRFVCSPSSPSYAPFFLCFFCSFFLLDCWLLACFEFALFLHQFLFQVASVTCGVRTQWRGTNPRFCGAFFLSSFSCGWVNGWMVGWMEG